MSHPDNAWSELELHHLLYGGYEVREVFTPGSGNFVRPLAAFSTLEEALKFMRDNIVTETSL